MSLVSVLDQQHLGGPKQHPFLRLIAKLFVVENRATRYWLWHWHPVNGTVFILIRELAFQYQLSNKDQYLLNKEKSIFLPPLTFLCD